LQAHVLPQPSPVHHRQQGGGVHHTLMHTLAVSHMRWVQILYVDCTSITGWDGEQMESWSSGAAWSEDRGGGRGTREGG